MQSQSAKIYINDFVPTNTQEKRRKEREIVLQAEEAKKKVEYVRGKLHIQGQKYTPKIQVPTPKDLINLDQSDFQAMQKLQYKKSNNIQQQGSIFTAYLAKTANFQQIRQYYIKMKIIQPIARHIPCAYIIQGMTNTTPSRTWMMVNLAVEEYYYKCSNEVTSKAIPSLWRENMVAKNLVQKDLQTIRRWQRKSCRWISSKLRTNAQNICGDQGNQALNPIEVEVEVLAEEEERQTLEVHIAPHKNNSIQLETQQ